MEIKLRPFKYHISLFSKMEARNDLGNKVKVSMYAAQIHISSFNTHDVKTT